MELQHIGRYDIKSLIGQGGMSAVYLGYDPRSQREVAIKILPPYYLHSSKFRERFEREALMIALLEHPAIVPVYDMGEEDGQPYIVMRYMSGGSLSDKLKKCPIALRDCMEMYMRLAPAMDTAHARGVTHRDVKPDNLLYDKYDNVFLSDFGLARLRETIGFANISDGSIMGTPAYMSPEQIQGNREIDGRSDIYSMGVVLYQMLCGEVPYYGSTAASVMMMHLVNPVPQIVDYNKSLPIGIQTVLETAMAKNPEDRFHTAAELARAIQAVTTGIHRRPVLQTSDLSASQHTRARPTALAVPDTPDAASIPHTSTQTPMPGTNPVVSAPADLATPSRTPPPAVKPSALAGLQRFIKRKFILPVWGWFLSVALILLLALVLALWTLNVFHFIPSPSSLFKPENVPIQTTSAAQVAGSTLSPDTSPIILGKADKLAFLNSSDIWVLNLDGSDPHQLTNDGKPKANLHWSPDGQSVFFTSGSCINLVGLQTQKILTPTCFSESPSISAFDISPDGQQVALGLENDSLYLLPYSQLFNLPAASVPKDLQSLAHCPDFAPYNAGDTLKLVNWSQDNDRLAMLLSTLVDGLARDEVTVLDINQCTASPLVVKEILPTHFLFTLRGYYDHPEITSLSWNGDDQLLLNGIVNGGFGDLQLYNLAQDQSTQLEPNGTCCYRDARWSPDGSYLFYSYQPSPGDAIALYYVPANGLDQPRTLASLALPADFLNGSAGSLEAALRSVH